jgi:WD40 repeat protein
MLSLAGALALQAQVLNVTSVQRLDVPSDENKVAQAVAISPQGDYLLLSTDTKQGLVKWDFATSSSQVLTDDAGTGSDVFVSEDGKQVVYGQVSFSNKRRQEAVKSIELSTGKKQTIVKPTRDLQGIAVEKSTVATITRGQLKTKALSGKEAEMSRPLLTKHHLKLFITRNGMTTQLAPNGVDERYIWASLSPDGNKVLYYVSGHGTFVCDVDGSNVIAMGNLTAPKWWDNNTIVGMDEVANEYTVLASSIVARTLDGQVQKLTSDDVIATYPIPSAQAGKIAFSTPDGKIYLITVD